MRIKALWEYPDQHEEVGTKHMGKIERFQATSRELIPLLASEPGELIEPSIAYLTRETPMRRYVMSILKRKKRGVGSNKRVRVGD